MGRDSNSCVLSHSFEARKTFIICDITYFKLEIRQGACVQTKLIYTRAKMADSQDPLWKLNQGRGLLAVITRKNHFFFFFEGIIDERAGHGISFDQRRFQYRLSSRSVC